MQCVMVDLMYHHSGADCLWFAQAEEESQQATHGIDVDRIDDQ